MSDTVYVRYLVNDIPAAVDFYTRHFGFKVLGTPTDSFADLESGSLRFLLSGDGSTARKHMPDGSVPVPGGWNRLQIRVSDIRERVDALRDAGVVFRGELTEGLAGSQVLFEDPSGNPVELFEPI